MSLDTYALTTFYYDNHAQSFSSKTVHKVLHYQEVLIKTTHSGICFTDVHAKSKECGLGHEGVGTIVQIGPAVSHIHVGDRVGWGWLHSSCGHCTTCVSGYRQYCAESRGFAFSDLDQGAFSDYRIIDAEFVYKIPDEIRSIDAAPLMCAGASVYEALDAAGTRPGDRVGVVGVGGLGHMAILFAKAMGCSVTAISNGPSKQVDTVSLGADEYRDTNDLDQCHHANSITRTSPKSMNINVLLITSNAVPEMKKLLPFLARRATIVLMTIQMEPLTIPYMQFVLPGHRMVASTEASRENHIKMLDFAARHCIRPWVEEFPMTVEGLHDAFDKLETGRMRYRGVLTRSQS